MAFFFFGLNEIKILQTVDQVTSYRGQILSVNSLTDCNYDILIITDEMLIQCRN